MVDASAWYSRNDHCSPHFHHCIEVVYVLEGELHVTMDGQGFSLGPDTLAINSSYTIHSYTTPVSSYAIICIIPISVVPYIRQLLSRQAFAVYTCPADEAGTLKAIMQLMIDYSGDNPLAMKGLCYTLLGLLIDSVGLTEARNNNRTEFIRDMLDFLWQHHTEPLSVGQAAKQFGYSRSRFSHIFRTCLGCTFSEYMNALRCRHAAQLLRETDMPIAEVAMAVGFESLRTFYRSFKKQYEMTPNGYVHSENT